MSRFLVTITPPTPNGDLHIGHIAGPFLSADVFTRVQRQQGHDCVLVSYSDDYQSYMCAGALSWFETIRPWQKKTLEKFVKRWIWSVFILITGCSHSTTAIFWTR